MTAPLATIGYRVVLFITGTESDFRTGDFVLLGRINDAKKGQAARLSVGRVNIRSLLEDEGIKKRSVWNEQKNVLENQWVDENRHPAQLYVWLPEQVRLKGGHLLATPVKVTLLNERVVLYEREN